MSDASAWLVLRGLVLVVALVLSSMLLELLLLLLGLLLPELLLVLLWTREPRWIQVLRYCWSCRLAGRLD